MEKMLSILRHWRNMYIGFTWWDKLTLYSFWVVVATALLIGYWRTIDNKFPLDIYDVDIPHAYVLPGDHILIDRAGCVKRERTVRNNREIVDTIIYSLPQSDSPTNEFNVFRAGTCYSVRFLFKVPKIPEGQTYTFRSELVSKVNPMTTVKQDLPDFQFTVVTRSSANEMELRGDYVEYVENELQTLGDPINVIGQEDKEIFVYENPSDRLYIRSGVLPDRFYEALVRTAPVAEEDEM